MVEQYRVRQEWYGLTEEYRFVEMKETKMEEMDLSWA